MVLFRHNRKHHARTNNLKNNLQDIFMRQMWCSDPEILAFIKPCLPARPNRTHPKGVRKLFLVAQPPPSSSADSSESDDSASDSASESDSEYVDTDTDVSDDDS